MESKVDGFDLQPDRGDEQIPGLKYLGVESVKTRGQAALRSGSCVCGCGLNFGYARRNAWSRSLLRTFALVCGKRWAPRSVQIAVPPENSSEHIVKFVERHLIGDRDQADDHGAHLPQNCSQPAISALSPWLIPKIQP